MVALPKGVAVEYMNKTIFLLFNNSIFLYFNADPSMRKSEEKFHAIATSVITSPLGTEFPSFFTRH